MNDPEKAALLQQIRDRDARIKAQEQEIRLLREKLDQLARRLFGKKSEQLDPNQLQLLLQELHAPGPAEGKESGPQTAEAPAAEPKAKSPRPRKARLRRLPEHLPVLEEVIVPEPVKARPQAWRQIGEEVSERLEFEPARFLRRRTVRPKYVRRESGEEMELKPVIAPCRRVCWNAASSRPVCWPTSWSVSAVITCHSTGRSGSFRAASGSISHARPWRNGWGWRRSGCGPSISRSAMECLKPATCYEPERDRRKCRFRAVIGP